MKAWEGPNFSENSKRCKGDEWPCAYCGKPIKDKAKALWVEVCCGILGCGPEHDPHGKGDKGPGHESMGSYPLGPECARKFKKLEKEKVS